MCDSVHDTLLNLSSDKIAARAKGRKSCSELIKAESSGEIYINDDEWKEILVASINGACKDADVALKKEKSPDIEVALFMKRLVKFIVQGDIWIVMKKLESTAKHCLEVLYSPFSAPYKDEYKHILCEILEPKISNCLPIDFFSKVLFYMRDTVFLNQRTNAGTSNLKLLKQFCKALFTDKCKSTKLLETLLNWFGDDLLPSVQENLHFLAATVADCCVYIMQYQRSNCIDIFFHYSKNILVTIIRQLSISQLRDSQRDSYLRFLFMYIKLSTSINMSESDGKNAKNGQNPISPVNDFPLLPEKNPLNENLKTLCDILTADDALRALMVYANNQVRQSHPKNSYVNSLSDTKVQSNLQIIAIVVVLHQQQYALGKSKLSYNDESDIALSNNSNSEESRSSNSSSDNNNNITNTNCSKNNNCNNNNNKNTFDNTDNINYCNERKNEINNQDKVNSTRAVSGKRSYEQYNETEHFPSISKNQLYGTKL